MKRLSLAIFTAASLVCTVSTAHAQTNFDSWVASSGNDANSCARPTPCATFTRAFAQTIAGGIIHAADTGAFGALNITHAITIDGGGIASPLTTGGSGYQISFTAQFYVTAGANDAVTIENFSMSGNQSDAGFALYGIVVKTVGSLHVQNCVLTGYGSQAISFQAAGSDLQLKDVTITDMPSGTGVYVSNARASLEHVAIHHTQSAVIAAGSSTVSITHSTANGNSEAFVAAYGPTAEIHVDDCMLTNNEWAVVAASGAKAYVSRSSLFNNVVAALFNDGSSFLISYGDNRFVGNASDGAFTSSATMK